MTVALRANGIDHLGLRVTDLKRSTKFYIEVLGMELIQDRPRMSFLRFGSNMLSLSQARDSEPVRAGEGMDHLAIRLEAGNYATVKESLERAGYKVSGRSGDIYFADPDGYLLQILTP